MQPYGIVKQSRYEVGQEMQQQSMEITLPLNLYLPSGLFHPYQLDEYISKFRGVWCVFFILIYFG